MQMSQGALVQPRVDDSGRALLARHVDFWHRKGMLYSEGPYAPLQRLWLPLADGTEATEDIDLSPAMLDLDRLAGEALEPGLLAFHGDQVATHAPYTPVPWVEAILGCGIRTAVVSGAMRSRAFIRDWDAWKDRTVRRRDDWLNALTQLTTLLAQRSSGRYAVAHTLMRGPSDLAEAILGPEFMCLSMYDHPQELMRFLEEVTEAFIDILRAQRACTPQVEGGYVNPFGVWAPGTVVRTQCDASAFLSPRQYKEWYLPYDERISAAVDYAIIHLHSGSLHTVDALLEVERPQAIEVAIDPEPSGPPVRALVPTLRKILTAKPLVIDGKMMRQEADMLRTELPPNGVLIAARITDF
jgi:hypothetical protein